MKFLLACLLFSAASLASHVPDNEPPSILLVGNSIDNLVRSGLEYIRKLMKESEPLAVPDIIPEQDISDDDLKVYLIGHLKDVLVSKASDFKVDYIENKVFSLWARFGLTIPHVHVEGKYDLKGSALGKAVAGKGSFSLDATDLVINGFTQMEIVDHSMHCKELTGNYTISDVKTKVSGLTVEGYTQQQLNDFFSKKVLAFFTDHMEEVVQKCARQVRLEANQIMKGKTLQELLDWLKHFIGQ